MNECDIEADARIRHPPRPTIKGLVEAEGEVKRLELGKSGHNILDLAFNLGGAANEFCRLQYMLKNPN